MAHQDSSDARPSDVRFRSRDEAGRLLAARLGHLRLLDPVVLALPRGGVPVALPIAVALEAPLDPVLVRRIGAPGYESCGIGAVVDGRRPTALIDEDAVARLGLPPERVAEARERELREVERRRQIYLRGRRPMSLQDRSLIVVADGATAGNALQVVLRALATAPARLVALAVPALPADTAERLRWMCDETAFLAAPPHCPPPEELYLDAGQPSDAAVITMLDRMSEWRRSA